MNMTSRDFHDYTDTCDSDCARANLDEFRTDTSQKAAGTQNIKKSSFGAFLAAEEPFLNNLARFRGALKLKL